MTLQAINAQALRPAVNFKANEKAETSAATATADAPAKENKHTALKVLGGATALALLGFGIYKMVKGKGAGNANNWTQIKEGVREITTKKGNKVRQYTGKNGDVLTVVKDKDGNMLKMIRKQKPVKAAASVKPSNLNTVEETVNIMNQQKGIAPGSIKPQQVPGSIAFSHGSTSTNPLAGQTFKPVAVPSVPAEAPALTTSRTTITNYVKADGTVAKKPVNVIDRGVLENGTSFHSNTGNGFTNYSTKEKDGKTIFQIFNHKNEEIASAVHKDGKILEQSKNMNAKITDGKLTYELI